MREKVRFFIEMVARGDEHWIWKFGWPHTGEVENGNGREELNGEQRKEVEEDEEHGDE